MRANTACNKNFYGALEIVQERSTTASWYCAFLLEIATKPRPFIDPFTGQRTKWFQPRHPHTGGIGHFAYHRSMDNGFTTGSPRSMADFDSSVRHS